jgi:hypothetical protein
MVNHARRALAEDAEDIDDPIRGARAMDADSD